MSKVNADLYIVFKDEGWDCSGGAADSIGVFDSLKAAQDFYESAIIETDWEHRFFDTLEEVEMYSQKIGNGHYEKRGCGDYRHTVCSEHSTPAQIYSGADIATIKDGQLVTCSHYCLLDKDARTYGWKDV